MEGFIPFVEHKREYKERGQLWRWLGLGRDGDLELSGLFRHWLQHKDDVCVDGGLDSLQGDPPPPKMYVTRVCPSGVI